MTDLVNISVADATVTALLGYGVVFVGLIALMIVVMVCGRYMSARAQAQAAAEAQAAAPETVPAQPGSIPAPGAAGELMLFDTDPRDAAMVMALVADKLGLPINELRFISIKEVKDDEI